MRILFLILFILFFTTTSKSQNSPNKVELTPKGKKHQLFIYWGWNRARFSKSDIHFHGADYNFTLSKVIAHDRQTQVGWSPYLNPGQMTIPQTDFRLGYTLNDHWSISVGFDHMKYVMDANQFVIINGMIQNSGTAYDGVYNHERIQLKTDFLKFEHTNGLNYVNMAVRHNNELIDLKRLGLPNITVNAIEGLDAGILYPRTNTTLLNYKRYDEFHLAGYGVGGMIGLNFTFFNHFFLQNEWKVGICEMPDIRTTEFTTDRADQHFLFSEFIFTFGFNFGVKKYKTQP